MFFACARNRFGGRPTPQRPNVPMPRDQTLVHPLLRSSRPQRQCRRPAEFCWGGTATHCSLIHQTQDRIGVCHACLCVCLWYVGLDATMLVLGFGLSEKPSPGVSNVACWLVLIDYPTVYWLVSVCDILLAVFYTPSLLLSVPPSGAVHVCHCNA